MNMNRNKLLHCLLYGVAFLVIVYEDRLPHVTLSAFNHHKFWSSVEWKHRIAVPGRMLVGFRTPGITTPYLWLKRRIQAWRNRHTDDELIW